MAPHSGGRQAKLGDHIVDFIDGFEDYATYLMGISRDADQGGLFEGFAGLPIRKVVTTRDPNTRLRSEEIEYYSLYHPLAGVMTPFQITRERNGIKVYQVFFDSCEYNTNISDSLFTKESLDERWAKIGKKQKPQKAKGASNSSSSSH